MCCYIDHDSSVNRKQSAGPGKAFQCKSPSLEVVVRNSYCRQIAMRLACNLTQNEIISGKICHNDSRATFANLQVGMWKREDDYIANYRLFHASSSSGVSHSRCNTEALAAAPSNSSASMRVFKKHTKWKTSCCNDSGNTSNSRLINSRVLINIILIHVTKLHHSACGLAPTPTPPIPLLKELRHHADRNLSRLIRPQLQPNRAMEPLRSFRCHTSRL